MKPYIAACNHSATQSTARPSNQGVVELRTISVSDEHDIAADIASVYDSIWNAQLWPRITSHVKKIEMLESSERHQRMLMTVEANGRLHTVESVREAVPGELVTYRQTRPPVFLSEHTGEWRFSATPGGVHLALVHRAVVDDEQAVASLDVATVDEAVELIARTLKANGARTVLAVKEHLESRAGAPAAR